jgi:predicted metal-binding membrane protein
LSLPVKDKATEALERLIGRERLVLISAIAFITLLSWCYLLTGAGTGMSPFAMSTWQFPPKADTLFGLGPWSAGYATTMIVMWFVMMVAMMLPSAAPLMLIYTRVWRQAQRHGQIGAGSPPVAAFLSGYLTCWLGFSVLATALQFGFEQAGLIDGMWMWSLKRPLTAALLIAAGLYQLSPLKQSCLSHCRSPAAYLAGNFHASAAGAFRLGLAHGTYCLGCCWVLMLLLFAGGVMNLVWIAGLTILVLIEKLAPFGARLRVPTAVVLIAGGLAIGWAA